MLVIDESLTFIIKFIRKWLIVVIKHVDKWLRFSIDLLYTYPKC